MAVSYIDYQSPNNQYMYDLRNNQLFKRDNQNYINALGRDQLNTLGNVSMLDIFLSKEKYVEPHIHQNASELVYCVSGSAVVSFINPFTNELKNIPIKPGQVANVPQGFWHYEVATDDNTHLLAIFDAPYPQAIYGSDILRLTPSKVMSDNYCLDQDKWEEAISPITNTVIIGPSADCQRQTTQHQNPHQHDYQPNSQTQHTQQKQFHPIQYQPYD